ncbi:MAG: hypothetical protein CMC80_02975 [Flavobacteriaceae bacterium]|nr:hypothetical protein [Flavobacteriaceae bacterium]|tara:strand:+ start:7260 stop:7793 length:534 start_codon:yes stop_codon:yes gene_type:complete
MEANADFDIQFSGLKDGVHTFDFQLSESFFETFDNEEFNAVQAKAVVNLHKKSTLMEAEFSLEGHVNVNCDLTNEPFDLTVSNSFQMVVKFGPAYSDDHEDMIVLPHGSHQFNVTQQLYELLVLSVPQKRVHPGVEDGSMKSEVLEKLDQLKPSANNHSSQRETDPRWDALKKLKKK